MLNGFMSRHALPSILLDSHCESGERGGGGWCSVTRHYLETFPRLLRKRTGMSVLAGFPTPT